MKEGSMIQWIGVTVAIVCFFVGPKMAGTQNLPILNMGFSGGGVGSDLIKVIERADLWRKHGVDVRPIYLTSGTLMAQTLSAGDIGIAGFDVIAMLKFVVSCDTEMYVISLMLH